MRQGFAATGRSRYIAPRDLPQKASGIISTEPTSTKFRVPDGAGSGRGEPRLLHLVPGPVEGLDERPDVDVLAVARLGPVVIEDLQTVILAVNGPPDRAQPNTYILFRHSEAIL